MKDLKHGVTIFDVKGAFLEKKRKVLMTVIPNREYFKLKEGIKEIDEKWHTLEENWSTMYLY